MMRNTFFNQPSTEAKKKPVHETMTTVLYHTAIKFDPTNHAHQGKLTEEITTSAWRKRQPIKVIVGTAIKFDPTNPAHQGKLTEEITTSARRQREAIKVIAGTAIEFDPNNPGHAGKATEEITYSQLYGRRRTKKRERNEAATLQLQEQKSSNKKQRTADVSTEVSSSALEDGVPFVTGPPFSLCCPEPVRPRPSFFVVCPQRICFSARRAASSIKSPQPVRHWRHGLLQGEGGAAVNSLFEDLYLLAVIADRVSTPKMP